MNPSFSKLPLVMLLCHSNRKVTGGIPALVSCLLSTVLAIALRAAVINIAPRDNPKRPDMGSMLYGGAVCVTGIACKIIQ